MQKQPKDEIFRHVTCEHLTVVHPSNRSKIEVSIDNLGAYIDIFNKSGEPVIKLSVHQDGRGDIKVL